jgi:hypothetical protein
MALRSPYGSGLMILAGTLGAAVGIYDYYAVSTGIDGTGGVELVIISCLLMIFGALVIMMVDGGFLPGLLLLLLLLDVVGTGLAAYFLESGLIMSVMAVAALGWIFQMNDRGRVA